MPARTALLLAIAFLSIGVFACETDGEEPLATVPTRQPTLESETRPFEMGISSLPPELTQESYAQTFELAAAMGEMIMIQRTPPWEELIAGEISTETARTTQREKDLAAEHGLRLFFAIDPTDAAAGRTRLVDLPPEMAGAGFADPTVRQAFLDYARYVAENYRPAYLALGVEINGYQHEHPEDFEQYVTLYHEAYAAVKERSPDTLVFPTFQLEELRGLLPVERPYPPQWFLLNRFRPNLDLMAVSSFPSLVFSDLDQMPADYYAQVQTFTDRPIALTGIGYASRADSGSPAERSERDQAAYLRRVLDTAEDLEMPLVVWFIAQDPSFTGEAPYDKIASVGLRRQDGVEKDAWDVWVDAARRAVDRAVEATPAP